MAYEKPAAMKRRNGEWGKRGEGGMGAREHGGMGEKPFDTETPFDHSTGSWQACSGQAVTRR